MSAQSTIQKTNIKIWIVLSGTHLYIFHYNLFYKWQEIATKLSTVATLTIYLLTCLISEANQAHDQTCFQTFIQKVKVSLSVLINPTGTIPM